MFAELGVYIVLEDSDYKYSQIVAQGGYMERQQIIYKFQIYSLH